MELEKQVRVIDDIRDELKTRTNTRLRIRANMGRSKIVESEGTLMQVHPSLFIMEVDRKRGRKARQSYQYVDVLTGMVELYESGCTEPIFHLVFDDETDEGFDLLEDALLDDTLDDEEE